MYPAGALWLVHHAQLRQAFHILFFTSLCFSFLIYLGLWHTPLLAKKKMFLAHLRAFIAFLKREIFCYTAKRHGEAEGVAGQNRTLTA